MAGLAGFSDNPFQSRSDLVRAAEALLLPVQKYTSPGGARIRFRPATAAHFDDVAAQLEGFARPFWALAGLAKAGSGDKLDVSNWLKGLESGTDPSHPEYWGNIGPHDQRMVEMESIAFLMLVAPDSVLSVLNPKAQTNLASWLRQINDHDIPQNNWLWFRVFVNLALVRHLGVPRQEVQSVLDDAFERLDSYKVDGPDAAGWSTDGAWTDFTKQADYYSGSFAIQFAQLLFVSISDKNIEEEAKRAAVYREEAKLFSAQYWRYFDPDGAAIPFGRSLTYRFAMSAFWAAAAVAGVELADPVSDLGTIKGLLFRHLRWWAARPDIFSQDGIVSIGFAYPNLYMSEEYNSPQSVYWCLKSFVALCLAEDHPFWSVEERPHPLDPSAPSTAISSIGALWPPRHIIHNTEAHHFLLSAGQMTRKPHKGREAKYGKFAYSSAFGFSVPTGQPMLQYIPPDSTLCLSIDGGETWAQHQAPEDVSFSTAQIKSPSGVNVAVPSIVSTWKPYPRLDLEIATTLIPLSDEFMGWHVRVHKVQWSPKALSNNPLIDDVLQLVEGGFAIPSLTDSDLPLPSIPALTTDVQCGTLTDKESSLLVSSSGAVGIVNISSDAPQTDVGVESQSSALKAGPNTNLFHPKTSIPIVTSRIPISVASSDDTTRVTLVSAVFGVSASCPSWHEKFRGWWENIPHVDIQTQSGEQKVTILATTE